MSFANFAQSIVGFLNGTVVPLIFSIAALAFLYGVLQYFFLNNGSEEAQKQGRAFVLWGLIALTVLFSTWGLVNVLLNTLGIQSGA